jgi:hypothetical protein
LAVVVALAMVKEPGFLEDQVAAEQVIQVQHQVDLDMVILAYKGQLNKAIQADLITVVVVAPAVLVLLLIRAEMAALVILGLLLAIHTLVAVAEFMVTVALVAVVKVLRVILG